MPAPASPRRLRHATPVALALVLATGFAGRAAAQSVFDACYVEKTGVLYLIDPTGTRPGDLPTACIKPDKHIQFMWVDGAGADHGLLTGLGDDDHPQYLLVNGSRAMTGNLTVNDSVGIGTTPSAPLALKPVIGPDLLFVPSGGPNADIMSSNEFRVGTLNTSPFSLMTNNQFRLTVAGDGKVGIGTITPGQQLTVAGTVESTTGGFKFPDGTVQTSAAASGAPAILADGITSTTNGFAVTGTYGIGTIPATGAGTRLMWYPGKAAFRAGRALATAWDDAEIGTYSTAVGYNTKASGAQSIAMGGGAQATGASSTAIGSITKASGSFATALGWATEASNGASTAMGHNSKASGGNSTAVGNNTEASGSSSTAMGENTKASGYASTAMGESTEASSDYSTAMGLLTKASGYASTAMGESTEASGSYSTAMGIYASTSGFQGSFVYGDASTLSTHALVKALANNEFVVRASGGTNFYSSSDLSTGVSLAPGAGAWASVSDRNRKHHFQDVSGENVLARIADIPIPSWSYRAQPDSIRHIGPMAQDFYAAFHLGSSDLTITSSDISGVNMRAIQALEQRTRELEAMRAKVASLEERLAALETALRLSGSMKP